MLYPYPMLLLIALHGCGSDKDQPVDTSTLPPTADVTPPAFTVAPTLEQAPDPTAPLGWRLTLTADEPVTVRVDVTDALGAWSHGPFETDAALDVWLHTWHPGQTHTVAVTATDAAGNASLVELAVTAPALPDDFPDIRLASADPARMEPGVTVVAPTKSAEGGATYIVALDAAGQVVWWFAGGGFIHGVDQLADGHLRYMRNKDHVGVIDLRGGVHAEYGLLKNANKSILVDALALHHDMITLPDGHLLTLGIEARELDYPLSEEKPAQMGPSLVAGDVILEIDALTGEIYQSWPLLDLLDPDRIGWDAVVGDYWEGVFEEDVRDWSHGNALQYDAAADRIWVSLRHQDAIVGIGRASGAVDAILGNHDSWDPAFADLLLDPVGDTKWAYHQHGHVIGANGNIYVFDNGNNRTMPPQPPLPVNESRAVEFAIDVEAGTAEAVWQWGDGGFSASLGNVQPLPETGNVLVVYGDVSGEGLDVPGVRIYEVTHTDPAEIVSELHIWAPPIEGAEITTFRAVRWPRLQVVPGY